MKPATSSVMQACPTHYTSAAEMREEVSELLDWAGRSASNWSNNVSRPI
jgi:hypothetical protein